MTFIPDPRRPGKRVDLTALTDDDLIAVHKGVSGILAELDARGWADDADRILNRLHLVDEQVVARGLDVLVGSQPDLFGGEL
jgi:hypothetical protein